ncbi:ion transporter [Spirochaeta africana]|uniref:Kef-type K+ ransport system, predicted NAD-binding component n=1 Tax=Spirochaeta africana (strain ATCC 700263 / DSM 8902 / Z-7692) TaxID=889378 RepID=H9UMA7_SPIAZ|nr:ion transporter [Spirochaeta africana]AFG38650.1 Kef-type K+ ransport system, predicted NAD-binding component [Spirochaeta africana DSM 8902]
MPGPGYHNPRKNRVRQRPDARPSHGLRQRLYDLLFTIETPAGYRFDVILIVVIALSVLTTMLESVAELRAQWGAVFAALEWGFTIVFSLEYLLRLVATNRRLRFAGSFFGVIDLLAVLPTWLGLLFAGLPSLIFLRTLRVLRVFRLLKLWKYSREAQYLLAALRASLPKISVFLFGVGTLIVVLGSVMYLVEGPENGFTNIFVSLYWTVVTITTVGYGDISPQTPLGQFISSVVMIMGYAIIAVPTGIVSAEIIRGEPDETPEEPCP